MLRGPHLTTLAAVLLCLVASAGCGGTNKHEETGGTFVLLAADGPESLDPGLSYSAQTYPITYATQRPLYAYRPGRARPVPDLATGPPVVSPDGRTVTVALRPGVRFSPPVNREVVADDVKYAIERAFTDAVPNAYAQTYFGNLEGVDDFRAGRAAGIAGVRAVGRRKLVLRLSAPRGRMVASALALPITAPVPREYARRLDAGSESGYGERQVATGPYRIASFTKDKQLRLVRNPNWNRDTDFRPAYLDRIVVRLGADPAVAARQILRGRSMGNFDFAPSPPQLRAARRAGRLTLVSLGGLSYIALNTRVAPFDDVNVRRAVLAGFDRDASRRVRGGALRGPIATHFIAPGTPGFEEAGGLRGPPLDFVRSPAGNIAVARQWLKRAGFRDGRYEGRPISMLGLADGVGDDLAQLAQQQLERLGFDVDLRVLAAGAMNERCGSPAAAIAVCNGGSWFKDFDDAESILTPLFAGSSITKESNTNWSQLDDPRVNRAIAAATTTNDPVRRARAWATVDRMVTSEAPAIPLLWDRSPYIYSGNVRPAINGAIANFDLSFTSLR